MCRLAGNALKTLPTVKFWRWKESKQSSCVNQSVNIDFERQQCAIQADRHKGPWLRAGEETSPPLISPLVLFHLLHLLFSYPILTLCVFSILALPLLLRLSSSPVFCSCPLSSDLISFLVISSFPPTQPPLSAFLSYYLTLANYKCLH